MAIKGKYNAWIKPSGQFIAVGYMQHNEWDSEYFKERFGDDLLDKLEEICDSSTSAYPHVALHKLGWIRLLTWTNGKTKALGNCFDFCVTDDTVDPSCTKQQKETLIDWCMENDYPYNKLFTE